MKNFSIIQALLYHAISTENASDSDLKSFLDSKLISPEEKKIVLFNLDLIGTSQILEVIREGKQKDE